MLKVQKLPVEKLVLGNLGLSGVNSSKAKHVIRRESRAQLSRQTPKSRSTGVVLLRCGGEISDHKKWKSRFAAGKLK